MRAFRKQNRERIRKGSRDAHTYVILHSLFVSRRYKSKEIQAEFKRLNTQTMNDYILFGFSPVREGRG